LTPANGIRRAGPPQAVQKVREDYYVVQLLLSEPPSADWKRLFYDTQADVTPDFPPRALDITGSVLRFRSDSATVEERTRRVDRWIERANQKEASLGARSEDERRRREEALREHRELAELNARWSNL
jgi:hypothetical protein